MKRESKIVVAGAILALLGGTVLYAQDRYSLVSPGGIAFADFRGYEEWSVVSSARTDEVLKVIVGNPTIIKAYKTGIPGSGQAFPEGSKLVKLQWKPKKSTEAPFAVDVPDTFSQAFVMEKDSKRFPQTGGWGYAVYNYEPKTEGKGLRFPPISETLNSLYGVRRGTESVPGCRDGPGHPQRA